MLQKTRGIVLRTVKYSESSIITTIYTEAFGLQTYIVSGARSAKSKSKAAFYRHGNLLELVVYHRETQNIMRISEVKFAHAFREIPFQIVKSSLLLFYIELLNKVLKEHGNNTDLFHFLFEIVVELDETDKALASHHIWFLLAISKYLGFFPASESGDLFDLREGNFTDKIPAHTNYLSQSASSILRSIIDPELKNYDQLQIPSSERKRILYGLLNYFRFHLEGFGEMQSLGVLEELFE